MPSALPSPGTPRRGPWTAALWLAPALLALNLALTFHNVWPTPWITTRHELSVELAVVVLALALAVEARGAAPRRIAAWLALSFTLLCIGRYAEVTAPALYGRRINLYWDGQHLPRVAAMLAQAAPAWLVAAAVLGVLAGLVGLYLVLRGCVTLLLDALEHTAPRRATAAAAAALVTLYAVPGARPPGVFSLPVTGTYAEQARRLHDSLTGADVRAHLDAPPLPDPDLAAGADVLLVFLESYGATTFGDARYAAGLAAPRAALAAAVDRTGRHAASALIASPTFGGASWLAHASLLSGIEIPDPASYAALLTRRRDTLVQRFAQAGFRAVAVMPGLKRAWPEGGFYGFQRVYGEGDLDYRGPAFGWWRIPDQYALAKLHALELTGTSRPPVFAFVTTISSHMPFRPTPPYQADWPRLLGSEPFAGTDAPARLQVAPDWTDPGSAYVDAMAYALRTLAGYLEQPAGRDQILVLVGDHQPAASVSGPGAGHQVPVHVIAHRPQLLDGFLGAGFTPGLTPADETIMPMHRLAPLLLSALDAAR